MKNNFKGLLGLAFSALLLASCNNDDDVSAEVDNQTIFKNVITAIGGADSITNAVSINYTSVGIAYEFQEDPEPVGGKVADFNYALIYNLEGTQSKQDWTINAQYAYATDFSFVETIDGTKGKSVGKTGTFSAHFESFGVTGDPMYSTKVASRQKTLIMSSPLALLKMIHTNTTVNGTILGTIHVNYNTSSLGFGASTPDIELVIDTQTNLPIRAQVLENDPLLGDVMYVVNYSNWTTVNGLKVPQKLEHVLDGNIIRTETLSDIEVKTTIDTSEVMVSDADAFPYDAMQASYGYLSSQLHYRTLMQTFPLDFPVKLVNSQYGVNSQIVPNDPNAYLVAGDLQSHYTFAFKIDGELLLYDSPINDRRSATVLSKIRSDFSTDPIKYVVHSHNHFDHIGGVRGNLGEGGDLIVGESSRIFMENVLQRPNTVVPNPIAGNDITVIGVSDSMTFGTGDEEVQLYTISSEHAMEHDFIVVYKPSTKTIYFNDLVNPGFIFVWDTFNAVDKARSIKLAKGLVSFVDSKGLDVETYHCSHGFTTQDSNFQTVRDLSNR